MGIEPGAFLGPEERRNMIYNSISLDDWQNYSGAAILRSLQERGMGINEGEFYAIRTEMLSNISNIEKISNLPDNVTIPAAFTSEGRFWHMRENFAYQIKYSAGFDEQGHEITKGITIQSNRQLSRDELLQTIDNMLEQEELIHYDYVAQGYSLTEIRALHRPGLFKK